MSNEQNESPEKLRWACQGMFLEGFLEGMLRAYIDLTPLTHDPKGNARKVPIYNGVVYFPYEKDASSNWFIDVESAMRWCEREIVGSEALEWLSEEVIGEQPTGFNDTTEAGNSAPQEEPEEPTVSHVGYTIYVPAGVKHFEITDPETARRRQNVDALASALAAFLGAGQSE